MVCLMLMHRICMGEKECEVGLGHLSAAKVVDIVFNIYIFFCQLDLESLARKLSRNIILAKSLFFFQGFEYITIL